MQPSPDLRDTEYAYIAAKEATEREARRRQQIGDRPNGEERWYLARKGQRFSDERAADLFEEYAVECYTPKVRTMVKIPMARLTIRQRRSGLTYREPKLVPLFATYRLIRLDLRRNDWRELFERASIHGLIYVDEFGKAIPAPVPQFEIDKLRAKEVNGAIPEAVTVRDLGWDVGEQARIKDGPFVGKTGVVEILPDTKISDLDDEAKCKLAVMMFGRVSLIEISLQDIEKV